MGMENFNMNKSEIKTDQNPDKKELFVGLNKKAKNVIIATGLALSAMMPNKAEAQAPKEKEVVFVTNPDDPQLKAYKDSLYAYKQGQRNLEKAKKSLDEYSKKLHTPIQTDEDKDLKIEDYKGDFDIHGDVSLHDHAYGDVEEYYDTKEDEIKVIEYEQYILKDIKPEMLLHLQAQIATKANEWNIITSNEFYPVFKEPVQQVRLDDSIKPIGKINIHGRSVDYYSELQKSKILDKLADAHIAVTKVGEGDDYTVSRFNESTKGWQENVLFGQNGEVLIDLDE